MQSDTQRWQERSITTRYENHFVASLAADECIRERRCKRGGPCAFRNWLPPSVAHAPVCREDVQDWAIYRKIVTSTGAP